MRAQREMRGPPFLSAPPQVTEDRARTPPLSGPGSEPGRRGCRFGDEGRTAPRPPRVPVLSAVGGLTGEVPGAAGGVPGASRELACLGHVCLIPSPGRAPVPPELRDSGSTPRPRLARAPGCSLMGAGDVPQRSWVSTPRPKGPFLRSLEAMTTGPGPAPGGAPGVRTWARRRRLACPGRPALPPTQGRSGEVPGSEWAACHTACPWPV